MATSSIGPTDPPGERVADCTIRCLAKTDTTPPPASVASEAKVCGAESPKLLARSAAAPKLPPGGRAAHRTALGDPVRREPHCATASPAPSKTTLGKKRLSVLLSTTWSVSSVCGGPRLPAAVRARDRTELVVF